MNWTGSIKSFTAYLKLERGMSQNTVVSYQNDLKNLGRWADEKELKPLKLSAENIREYLTFLHETGISERSQARALSTLRALYKFFLLEEQGGTGQAIIFLVEVMRISTVNVLCVVISQQV